MLNLLRKKKVMKKILWGLAIIIIPAFVLWGAGSLSKRKFAFKYVGTIEGKKVPVEEFVKSLKNVQVGIILNYINQPEVMEKIQSDRKLTNRLAWENIILQRAATKNKITVSDKAVISFVMTHPLFSRGGTFDGKLYDYILKNNFGMTPRDFEESVRSFLVSMKYRTALVKDLDVTDKELFESYKNEFEKAAFYCVLIDKERFKKDSAVSDEEIAAFYEENKENFRAAEKVVVQYISFPHKEKGEKGDALLKLKRFYEILKSKPQNMEALAEDLNLTVKETAPFSREEIVPEVGNLKEVTLISFKIRPRLDMIPVIDENELGASYIIRVKEKIPSRIKPKNEVSEYMKAVLADRKAMLLAEKKADEIYQSAKNDELNIKVIAKKYDLTLRETPLLTRFEYIEGIGEAYQAVDEAFKLKPGAISEPIESRRGFIIIEPFEFQGVDEKKFREDKEDYRNKCVAFKKMKAFEAWSKKMQANSSLNVDLDSI